jgi:hypothetical protein
MLDLNTCKQILNNGETTYTDEQVEMISELLWRFAQLTLQTLEEEENKSIANEVPKP